MNRWKLWIMWISRCKTPFSLKKGENGCAKLIHKTGDKMWIMWTTRKSNIYFVQLVWFTIKLAGWQKKKRFTWIAGRRRFTAGSFVRVWRVLFYGWDFPGTAGSAYLSRARAQNKCKKIMKSLNKIPVSVRINKIV